MLVNINWETINQSRGDISRLKQWYGDSKEVQTRTVTKTSLNYKGEKYFELEGIAGGFSESEVIIINQNEYDIKLKDGKVVTL